MIPLSLVSSGYSLAHDEAGKQQTSPKLRGKKKKEKSGKSNQQAWAKNTTKGSLVLLRYVIHGTCTIQAN